MLFDSVPTTVIARWLGFANPEAYRRFVRREMGISFRELRARVRKGEELTVANG